MSPGCLLARGFAVFHAEHNVNFRWVGRDGLKNIAFEVLRTERPAKLFSYSAVTALT